MIINTCRRRMDRLRVSSSSCSGEENNTYFRFWWSVGSFLFLDRTRRTQRRLLLYATYCWESFLAFVMFTGSPFHSHLSTPHYSCILSPHFASSPIVSLATTMIASEDQPDDSLHLSLVEDSSSSLNGDYAPECEDAAPVAEKGRSVTQSSTDISSCVISHLPSQLTDDFGVSDRTSRSLSNHGNAISASMRTEVGGEPCVFLSQSDTQAFFFPDHKVLQGGVSTKVVRYAQRRMTKCKIAPCQRAKTMPILRHDQLELGALLGEGSFSSAFSIKNIADYEGAERLPEPSQLVVKVLRKKLLRNPPMLAACAADICKEGLLLSRLSHPNVLSIHAWAPNGVHAFGNGRHDATFLVLGRLATTLSDKFRDWRLLKQNMYGNNRGFLSNILPASKSKLQAKWKSFEERMNVMDSLAEAVVYLHAQQILHRDLKPDNIGFDAQGVLKVFDFDVARVLPMTLRHSPTACFKMTKRVGSPRYMSPECARGDAYNTRSDVYTVTLLLHELYSLDKPYDDIAAEMHDDMVFYSGARPPLPYKWPLQLHNFLERGWNERISSRPTMKEFQAQWRCHVKPCLLAEKRKRYSRGLGKEDKQVRGPSKEEDEIFRNSTATAKTSSTRIWDSARTNPDSIHEPISTTDLSQVEGIMMLGGTA